MLSDLRYLSSYYFDPTAIFIIIGMVITVAASCKVKFAYGKYSRKMSSSPLTGAQVAQKILRDAGITDVVVQRSAGHLSDHYNPRKRTVNLSSEIYNSKSIAAISIAAHECGHAIQHDTEYSPLSFRSILVPVANIGSTLAWPLIFAGMLFNNHTTVMFLNFGIFAFSLAVLFQIVTLPVEFDASKRALTILTDSRILTQEEMRGAKSMLNAAALTYVAAAMAALLQLVRIVLLTKRRR
jgi:Predicted Zn-dependent protease